MFKTFKNFLNESQNFFVRITPGEMIGRILVSGNQLIYNSILKKLHSNYLDFNNLEENEQKLIQSVPRYELHGLIENLNFNPPGVFEFPFYIIKTTESFYLIESSTSKKWILENFKSH